MALDVALFHDFDRAVEANAAVAARLEQRVRLVYKAHHALSQHSVLDFLLVDQVLDFGFYFFSDQNRSSTWLIIQAYLECSIRVLP